jgi:hypothetical protein
LRAKKFSPPYIVDLLHHSGRRTGRIKACTKESKAIPLSHHEGNRRCPEISSLRQQLNGDTTFPDFFSCLMRDSLTLDILMTQCDIPRE